MFSPHICILTCVITFIYHMKSCTSEPAYPPSLVLYSPGDEEYTEVLIKRVGDNLTLACELRPEHAPQRYVWNYVPDDNNTADRSFSTSPGLVSRSTLFKVNLSVGDSGMFLCSAPPYSAGKYVHVQTQGPARCARSSYWCGSRCVLATYVCDGYPDCVHGEDELPSLCGAGVCHSPGKLNCSSGRCISSAACCRVHDALCQQPKCCDEYPKYQSLAQEGYVDVEFPPQFEDRHAPDDYGFIQSTIYTVTACALIFMIAVVLLVSAICKMHMKRAALRGYTHADRATRQHYTMQYAQTHRFPPCYEASRLLEAGVSIPPAPASPPLSPRRGPPSPPVPPPRGLARLSSIFSSRYRQVPSQCMEVELQSVPQTGSPVHSPALHYRSPAGEVGEHYPDLSPDFLFADQHSPDLARDLNLTGPPLEVFRNRNIRRNTLERVMEQLDRQRLTLQLGRFHFSIPRFGRGEQRPDTPNVAEINISELDFVRMESNDTYTLNGRTIRLLGAEFDNYPLMAEVDGVRPPSYTEAVRYKLYGPPPEYLSREGLDNRTENVDQEATNNVEMPPCYEDLACGGSTPTDGNVAGDVRVTNDVRVINNDVRVENSDVTATENANAATNVTDVANGNDVNPDIDNGNVGTTQNCDVTDNVGNKTSGKKMSESSALELDDRNGNAFSQNDVNVNTLSRDDVHVETLSSIIDNLPAIDSDVNANDNAEVPC